jgi:hypothetical protein
MSISDFTPGARAEEEEYLGAWGRWESGLPVGPVKPAPMSAAGPRNHILDWAELAILRNGPCPYARHRESDWINDVGCSVCGICHPPVPGATARAGARRWRVVVWDFTQ